MNDNKNGRDFSSSDFVSDAGEEKSRYSPDESESGKADGYGSDSGASVGDNAGSSGRTDFLRDGAKENYGYSGNQQSYQDFGDFRRWDSFSLDEEKRAKAKFSRFFLASFIYLLVANIFMIAAQLLIGLTQPQDVAEVLLNSPTVILTLNSIVLYAIGFPILYLIIRKMSFVPRRKSRLSVKDLFVYLLIGEALMYIGSLVASTVMGYFDAIFGAENSNEVVDTVTSAPIWLVIIVACVLAPIFEELIFRKLLMDRLGAYGDRMIILVSALAFAFLHGNLHQFFYSFTLGLLLAFIYSRTGRVIYPIIIHAAVNTLGSVLPILALPHMEKLESLIPMMEQAMADGQNEALSQMIAENLGSILVAGLYSALISGLAIAGIVLLIIKLRKKSFFVSDRCEVFIPKQRRGAVIFGNVGVILFLVFTTVTIIFDLISPLIYSIGGGV